MGMTFEQAVDVIKEYMGTSLCVNGRIEQGAAEAVKVLENCKWRPASPGTDPEEDGWYLTTADGEICGEDHPVTGINEFEDGKWDEDRPDYKCILAWKPMPEPWIEN